MNISETVKAGAKMHGMTFNDLDICQRIAKIFATTAKVIPTDLDLLLKDTNLKF